MLPATLLTLWAGVAFAQQPAGQGTGQVDWNAVFGQNAKGSKLAPATPLKPIGEGSTGPLGLPANIDKLRVADSDFLHWPLPPGEEAYAWVNGAEIKKMEEEVVAISEKSRADGNLLWGRIAGTPYDHMSADWVEAHFKSLGLEVHREEQTLPPEWFPISCDAELVAGGKTVPLKTAMPVANSVGTGNNAVDAEALWVGLGLPADFMGRDVKGKAVFIYSWPTPGGRDNTAIWNGALKRAQDGGAALILIVLGFPGDGTVFESIPSAPTVPTLAVSDEEGTAVREAIEQGKSPTIRLRLNTKIETGLKTETTWGVLPGQSSETVLIMAHHDCFFDGALDNASGMAMLQYMAAHLASIPKEQRRRTYVFLDTPIHHLEALQSPSHIGSEWVRDNFAQLFPNTVLIVNCEHPAQTQFYFQGGGLMSSNTSDARRWYANGSDAFKKLVTDSLREFGVGTYTRMEERPGGELGQLYTKAPSFHIIDHIFYHTTLDTSDWTPASGMEAATRAYLKILDGASQMSASEIKENFRVQ
jgi:peptidase M28-like protein